ncbi:hypothetical protein HON59_01745 [bacterium]|jgi:hypothetical protein|nr:hypothetical protein [bacterium]MBT3730196.1 hypothetical protein [bacterium]MBT4894767.1 hypothetical protein [bacterium]
MQKTITKTLILAIVLTAALGVNYLFAAWTGPTQAPPAGNTDAPVHVGTTDQVKNGGLSVDALSVFGNGYFQGNVGVGVVAPSEALEINGRMKIGDSTETPEAGTIRWTGADFEGYNGSAWVSLVSGEVVITVDPNYTECVNVGGSWIDAQSTCYVAGSSCPSGWSPNASYSSAIPSSCSTCSGACTTGSHFRENKTSACTYRNGSTYLSGRNREVRCNVGGSATCYALQTEIGCTKN